MVLTRAIGDWWPNLVQGDFPIWSFDNLTEWDNIKEEQQRGDSGIPYNRLIFVLIWKLFVLILKILILVLNWIFQVKVLFNVLYKGHPLPLPSMMYVRTYKMVTAKDYHLWYNQIKDLTGIFAKEWHLVYLVWKNENF